MEINKDGSLSKKGSNSTLQRVEEEILKRKRKHP